ncbi:MAG: GAF domain-containing protein [Candidatus Eisenbacteria bacterium]
MSESRAEAYRRALGEIRAVTEGVDDWIANLANAAAILYERLPFSWIGFYRVRGDEMILGPFQGKSACVRIARGRGVCGAAWAEDRTQVVPDVHAFPGHIACDEASRSEVVVPLHFPDGSVWGVFDVDSREPDDFSADDVAALDEIARLVETLLARTG